MLCVLINVSSPWRAEELERKIFLSRGAKPILEPVA